MLSVDVPVSCRVSLLLLFCNETCWLLAGDRIFTPGVNSPFGIVITQWTDDQICVLYAEEFERPDYNEMLSKIWTLMTEFELSKKNGKIYLDGANPSVIKSLKLQLGEDPDYDKVIAWQKSQKTDWTKVWE